MLCKKKEVRAFQYPKTLVRTAAAVQTLLSSNDKGNLFDLHEKLFLNIRR